MKKTIILLNLILAIIACKFEKKNIATVPDKPVPAPTAIMKVESADVKGTLAADYIQSVGVDSIGDLSTWHNGTLYQEVAVITKDSELIGISPTVCTFDSLKTDIISEHSPMQGDPSSTKFSIQILEQSPTSIFYHYVGGTGRDASETGYDFMVFVKGKTKSYTITNDRYQYWPMDNKEEAEKSYKLALTFQPID